MGDKYKTITPSEIEFQLMREIAGTATYKATNLTSARLKSLANRGYVERQTTYWKLTGKGRLALAEWRERSE